MAIKTGAIVVPIWIEDSDRVFENRINKYFPKINLKEKLTIKIGNPFTVKRFKKATSAMREQVSQGIVSRLLELADETD